MRLKFPRIGTFLMGIIVMLFVSPALSMVVKASEVDSIVESPVVNSAPTITDIRTWTGAFGDITGQYAHYYDMDTPVVGGTARFYAYFDDPDMNMVYVSINVIPDSINFLYDINGLPTGYYYLEEDTTARVDGAYTVFFFSGDYNGETDPAYADAALPIIIDNTAPTAEYDAVTENISTPVSGFLPFSATFIDEVGLNEVYLGIDDYKCVSAPTDAYSTNTPVNGQYYCGVDTRLLSDGPHTIYLYAIDKAGNITYNNSKTIIVDNTTIPDDNAPTVTPKTTLPSEYLTENTDFFAKFEDDIKLIRTGFILRGPNEYEEEMCVNILGMPDMASRGGIPTTSETRSCTVVPADLGDGDYELYGYAIDSTEQRTEVLLNKFKIGEPEVPTDTTAPVLVTKDVTRDEGESFPDFSEFILSNPENLPVTCTTVLASDMFVSQPNANKLFTITCSITDEAGNTTSSTSNLIVNNVQPQVVVWGNPDITVTEGTTVNVVANILHGNSLFSYNWFGDCSGSGSSALGLTGGTSVPSAVGSYVCAINVTDADGDTTVASLLVNVTAPSTFKVDEKTTTAAVVTDTLPSPTTEPKVEGTSITVSSPVSTVKSGSNNANTENTTTTNGATSPVVIICLVAGAILIILLLLFLFMRGNDEEVQNVKSV